MIVAQCTLIISREIFLNSSDQTEGASLQLVISIMFAVNAIYTTYLSTFFFSNITNARNTYLNFRRISVLTISLFLVLFIILNYSGDKIIQVLLSSRYSYESAFNLIIISEMLKSLSLPIVFYFIEKRHIIYLMIVEILAFVCFFITLSLTSGESNLVSVGSAFVIGAFVSFISLLYLFLLKVRSEDLK